MADPIKLECVPVGGVNTTDNYARLPPGKMFASSGFLYERNKAVSAPGWNSAASTGMPSVGKVLVAESFNYAQGASAPNPWTFLVGSDNNLYLANSDTMLIAGILPPASTVLALGAQQFNNMALVIGNILIGNNPDGLIQWNLQNSPDYNIIIDAPWRYVTGHVGRALGAYQAGIAYGYSTFAWSALGDVTTWTSTDGEAGQEFIANCPDQITGLGTLHNIVVILRQYGIHLGYPTGTLPPYSLQAFALKGGGCFFPSTAAWSDTMVFFVGQDDVYTFDLQTIRPIGNDIKDMLLSILKRGQLYRGFITRNTVNGSPRLRYHLMPLNFRANEDTPHFVYDVESEAWSNQSAGNLGGTASWAFTSLSPAGYDLGAYFVDTAASNPKTWWWDQAMAPLVPPTLSVFFGNLDETKDYKVVDVMVRTNDLGVTQAGATLQSNLNEVPQTSSIGFVVGSSLASHRWVRKWVSRQAINGGSLVQVGNDFTLQIGFGIGVPVELDYIALLVQEVGEYRGY